MGPVDTRMKKEKLTEIATALGLDSPGPTTVKKLVKVIKDHLSEHPELAEVPKFQGLYSYRPSKVLSQKQAKKSTDKAAEDVAESKKGAGTVSEYIMLSTQALRWNINLFACYRHQSLVRSVGQ